MKKLLFLAIGLAMTLTVSAQGTFNGNTAASTIGAAGKIFEFGGAAASSGTYGQWFIGPANTVDASTLTAVGSPKAFSTGTLAGYCQPGSIITSYAIGDTITVQLRAWAVAGGADWATGSTVATGFSGVSDLVQVKNLSASIATPPQVTGFKGFTLTANVPEPSTIALGVMGLSVLLFRRRK